MKLRFSILLVLLLVGLCGCATPRGRTSFAGVYEGTAVKETTLEPGVLVSRSVVDSLEVKTDGTGYRVSVRMNAQWQEDGMDRISNTSTRWSGHGLARDGTLVFHLADEAEPSRTSEGRLRVQGKDLRLTLDGDDYLLHPVSR